MADDDVGVAHRPERSETLDDLVHRTRNERLPTEPAVSAGERGFEDRLGLARSLADVDVATDRDRRRRAAIDGAALAVVCGLAARLVEREFGRSEPAIAEARGAIDGDLRAGADPDLDRLGRRRRDPRVPDGEAPGRRHDLAREKPADDRERFLERRRARRQARAHRGELALVVAEAALEDEASPRERRQRPHLLRHEDRIPERQEAAGGPVSPLGEQSPEHRDVLVVGHGGRVVVAEEERVEPRLPGRPRALDHPARALTRVLHRVTARERDPGSHGRIPLRVFMVGEPSARLDRRQVSRAILPSNDAQPREAAARRRQGVLRQPPELRRSAGGRADGVGRLRLAPRGHRARAHRPGDPGDDVRDDHPLSMRAARPRPRARRSERQAGARRRRLGCARAERSHARRSGAARPGVQVPARGRAKPWRRALRALVQDRRADLLPARERRDPRHRPDRARGRRGEHRRDPLRPRHRRLLRRTERLVRVGGPPALARAAVSRVRGGDADGPRRGPTPRGRRRYPQPQARDGQPAHPRRLEARRDGERPAIPPRGGEGRARRRQDRRVSPPRLGIVLSPFATRPVAEFVAVAREAEARGYHTAWVGESSGYDAISLMTLIASHTERIHVSSAVIPVQTRTPVVLGVSAASLGHVAPGRVALGLGLSSRTIVSDWHGLPFGNSLRQIREAVQIIRLAASGERVNFEGAFYHVKNFRMTAPPPEKPVRVVLAALGPGMLELAGEIADGVVLNWIPPETVPASIKHLEAGARRAGRALDGFEIASFVRTCVTDDPTTAREALAREITGYASVDAYASFFRSAGFGDEVDAVTTAWKAGDRGGRGQAGLAALPRRPRRGR